MKARRKQLPGILMALGFVLPTALMAQNDQQMPSPTQPGAVQRPGSAQLSADDRKFLQDAAIGGIEEVELGKLAVQEAASDQVRQIGQRIADDHTQANEQLQSLAQAKGLSLPTRLDAKHQKEVDRLQKLSGAEFDRAYIKLMIEDHQKDIREFRKVAEHGADADIKSLAAATLPKLHDHLAMARDAARTAKAGEHGKQSATGAASDQVHDRTTGAASDNASGEAQSERNRDSTAPARPGQSKQ